MRIRLLTPWLFILAVSGCSNSEDMDYFNSAIQNALKESDQTTIVASKLARFPFKKLCFDRNGDIELSFFTEGHKDADVVLTLDYDNYYIDTPSTLGTIAGMCVTSDEKINLRRQYIDGMKPSIYLTK